METTNSFFSHYDTETSTLTLSGIIDRGSMPRVLQEVQRAYRRTACRLTIDLSHAQSLPAHLLGVLVHVCNTEFPGSFVQPPSREQLRAIA
jgi:hypothetical protein